MKKILLMAVGLVALSGCATSTVKKNWNCNAQDGMGCKTISEIQSTIVRNGKGPRPIILGSSPELQFQGVPMWERVKIMKIFVADFVDDAENYHTESVIYTVISNGGWAKK